MLSIMNKSIRPNRYGTNAFEGEEDIKSIAILPASSLNRSHLTSFHNTFHNWINNQHDNGIHYCCRKNNSYE